MNYNKVIEIQNEMVELFKKLSLIEKEIKDKLSIFSDGKLLKGNELVGWLGEIYGKSLWVIRLFYGYPQYIVVYRNTLTSNQQST
ncbi:MAG: hypothetical protein GX660_12275 [Clostridiaceae bacterium]|nr:hypothetical protein [Clostridiaceae bacterium]